MMMTKDDVTVTSCDMLRHKERWHDDDKTLALTCDLRWYAKRWPCIDLRNTCEDLLINVHKDLLVTLDLVKIDATWFK